MYRKGDFPFLVHWAKVPLQIAHEKSIEEQ